MVNPATDSLTQWFTKTRLIQTFFMTIILALTSFPVKAQEIDFGSFGNYTITLENIAMNDFTFQEPIVTGGGIYEVELVDAFVLGIIGVKYLDVGVSITGDGELLLDGDISNSGDPERSVPFTLKAAYANRGQNNISDVKFITIASNLGEARFPVLARQNLPPGPPPPPPTESFDQSQVEEIAYLYLYGEIDVGNVLAGEYIGTITINVQYDNIPNGN